jgi:hypothetical protein
MAMTSARLDAGTLRVKGFFIVWWRMWESMASPRDPVRRWWYATLIWWRFGCGKDFKS